VYIVAYTLRYILCEVFLLRKTLEKAAIGAGQYFVTKLLKQS